MHAATQQTLNYQLVSSNVGDQDLDYIKLRILAAENIEKGQYAALSYTWGQQNSFITTTATLGERLKGFPLNKLPRTLRDAVQMTRTLGFQYLWVDALYILQGSYPEAQDDWKYESGCMDAVYTNATFTIVAAGATHANSGLFSISVLPYVQTHDKYWFRNEPINSRGWALQEWLMSYRKITFTSQQTFYSCSRHIPEDLGLAPYRSLFPKPGEFGHNNWYQIVKPALGFKGCPPACVYMAMSGFCKRPAIDRCSP
jgi:hypothetical protein